MKPIIVKNSIVPVLLSWFFPVAAITLWPFIFVREGYERVDRIIQHETIHWHQAAELLVLPFYLIYLLNWLFNLLRYRNTDMAYYEILAEKEAYRFQDVPGYLDRRVRWAWLTGNLETAS